MPGYETLPGFEQVYLEDSWVLDICRNDFEFPFKMEFVLRENSRYFSNPKPNEAHCYRMGWLHFPGIQKLVRFDQVDCKFTDASGGVDFGNNDLFQINGGVYDLEGDWGRLVLACELPSIEFLSEEPREGRA